MINLFSQQLITLHQRLKPLLETSFKDVREFGKKVFVGLDLLIELCDSAFLPLNRFSIALMLMLEF